MTEIPSGNSEEEIPKPVAPESIERTPDPLPEGSKRVYTYHISDGKNKIEWPLYEVPTKDGKDNPSLFYFIGYPKIFLNGEVKKIVETSPYWGLSPKYEDEAHYYYFLGIHREENETVSQEELDKRVKFRWERAREAFMTLTRMAKW